MLLQSRAVSHDRTVPTDRPILLIFSLLQIFTLLLFMLEFVSKIKLLIELSQSPRDYLKNHWTNTRIIWTHLNAFFKVQTKSGNKNLNLKKVIKVEKHLLFVA